MANRQDNEDATPDMTGSSDEEMRNRAEESDDEFEDTEDMDEEAGDTEEGNS